MGMQFKIVQLQSIKGYRLLKSMIFKKVSLEMESLIINILYSLMLNNPRACIDPVRRSVVCICTSQIFNTMIFFIAHINQEPEYVAPSEHL